jgi:mannose-1-phosphate guanylyltransferase
MEQGGLWNAFIFAASAHGLLRMFRRTVPRLIDAYLEGMSSTGWRPRALAGFYESTHASDFSRDVLERCGADLRVVPVSPCGWTDLGTPARLEAWLERKRTPRGSPHGKDASPRATSVSS